MYEHERTNDNYQRDDTIHIDIILSEWCATPRAFARTKLVATLRNQGQEQQTINYGQHVRIRYVLRQGKSSVHATQVIPGGSSRGDQSQMYS